MEENEEDIKIPAPVAIEEDDEEDEMEINCFNSNPFTQGWICFDILSFRDRKNKLKHNVLIFLWAHKREGGDGGEGGGHKDTGAGGDGGGQRGGRDGDQVLRFQSVHSRLHLVIERSLSSDKREGGDGGEGGGHKDTGAGGDGGGRRGGRDGDQVLRFQSVHSRLTREKAAMEEKEENIKIPAPVAMEEDDEEDEMEIKCFDSNPFTQGW
ncbi:hypothetical protein DY000_02058165 [Brassica cretica]|uniref:Uncharacterized protein n=1 Tax=Brassica cretica TaxID=69181 RepID=A0ABQ7AC13_BRACR|nr:hypothetical protein DY000_02058165 [Brassica cretica]